MQAKIGCKQKNVAEQILQCTNVLRRAETDNKKFKNRWPQAMFSPVIFPVAVCPSLDRAGHLSVTRHVQTSKVIVSAPINKVHWPLALMGWCNSRQLTVAASPMPEPDLLSVKRLISETKITSADQWQGPETELLWLTKHLLLLRRRRQCVNTTSSNERYYMQRLWSNGVSDAGSETVLCKSFKFNPMDPPPPPPNTHTHTHTLTHMHTRTHAHRHTQVHGSLCVFAALEKLVTVIR